jgi:hypothetical protein
MFASTIYIVIKKSISLRFSKLCYWLCSLNWYYLHILFFSSRLLFSALLPLTFLKIPLCQPSTVSAAASYQSSFLLSLHHQSLQCLHFKLSVFVCVRACVHIFLLRLTATEYIPFSTHCCRFCTLLASNSVVTGSGVVLASPFMCVVACNQTTDGHTALYNQQSFHSFSCNVWFPQISLP